MITTHHFFYCAFPCNSFYHTGSQCRTDSAILSLHHNVVNQVWLQQAADSTDIQLHQHGRRLG